MYPKCFVLQMFHQLVFINCTVYTAGELSYVSDPCQKIVFASEEPSICMLYDSRTGLHSVWKIRKALPEVCALHRVPLRMMFDMGSV
jgi:anaphase-promoting complex subunit 1